MPAAPETDNPPAANVPADAAESPDSNVDAAELALRTALAQTLARPDLSPERRRSLHTLAGFFQATLVPDGLDELARLLEHLPAVPPPLLPPPPPADAGHTPKATTAEPAPVQTFANTRYLLRGPLGQGGMGVVWRVYDPTLGREVALKVAQESLLGRKVLLQRFVEEARVQAQLQHPNLVPVHELGTLQDGRPYFTMDVIRGRPLSLLIAQVHAHLRAGETQSPDGWSLRRLLSLFAQAARAVGHAHARGVIHRDLKPDNLLVGDQGQIRVVDWGIARVSTPPDPAGEPIELHPEGDAATLRPARRTLVGAVTGTPAFMPPEQARGDNEAVDARADVYALGAVLYTILTQYCPYEDQPECRDPLLCLEAVRRGAPTPAPDLTPVPIPDELLELLQKAMSRDREHRFSDGNALAAAVESFLDGARKREQALAIVSEALGWTAEAARLREEATNLRAQAQQQLATVAPWAPETEKAPAWAAADRANALERAAELCEIEREQALQAALTHAPDLPEAREALAETWYERHRAAEAARDHGAAEKAQIRLQTQVAALDARSPKKRIYSAWLLGKVAVSLVTDPPGATVYLEELVPRNRRLIAEPRGVLGRTPLRAAALKMGTYLLRIRHPTCEEVRYPVQIRRGEHWQGIPPGEILPQVIPLPRAGSLGPEACFVPAGWCPIGGDPAAPGALTDRTVWIDGFVIERHRVDNRSYLRFLDSLLASGQEELARQCAPRVRGGSVGDSGSMIYGLGPQGFHLRPDADGDIWEPEWPVLMVDAPAARAYAEWWSNETGHRWRLPEELEWEKAARGVDGRPHPWGEGFDPTYCWMRDSRPGRPMPGPVDQPPVDESVYGVRGMAGNARDWTATPFVAEGLTPDGQRLTATLPGSAAPGGLTIRGGAWSFGPAGARICRRAGLVETHRYDTLGFRLARDLENG